jgi:peptidoglycan hydrolase-like protein with peptidoglycan-binding domain
LLLDDGVLTREPRKMGDKKELRRGMVGSDVVRLQMALRITADGVFGRQTEAALRQYQRARGLFVDGRVGPETRKALGWETEADK